MSSFSYVGTPRAKSRLIVVSGSCVLGSGCVLRKTTAAAQTKGPPARPTRFDLCASYIPDATKVEMCLRSRTPDLSPACRSVFSQSSASVVGANQ